MIAVLYVALFQCYIWHCYSAICGIIAVLYVALSQCCMWHCCSDVCGIVAVLYMALLQMLTLTLCRFAGMSGTEYMKIVPSSSIGNYINRRLVCKVICKYTYRRIYI